MPHGKELTQKSSGSSGAKLQPNNLFSAIIEHQNLPPVDKRQKRIAQEAFVVMAAGGETTGRVLTTTTYFLLANREIILAKLKAELEVAMLDPNVPADLKVIEKLPWLVRLRLKAKNQAPSN